MPDERDAYEILQVLPDAHANVIRAAYRALAALTHPDRDCSVIATQRMAQLNAAYERVRTPDRRAVYDAQRRHAAAAKLMHPTSSAPSSSPRRPSSAATVSFGRYQGWTISELARHDPDYLRWLSRHSSGLRYRSQIDIALQATSASASGMRRTATRGG